MPTPQPLGFWLKLLDQLIDEQFAQTLTEHGVTRRQWQLLNVLSRADATLDHLNAAIAPFLASNGTESAAPHMVQLVENGWVKEEALLFCMTGAGRTRFSQLAAIVRCNRETMAQGIEAGDHATALNVLERMSRNLGWDS